LITAQSNPVHEATSQSAKPPRQWSPRSIAILFLSWLILQIGGLFTPGLLDDVDSIYIEIAREMLHRHDYVTPYINGVRFFDKPPLMYWMAAASMRLFGIHDWAARLPLALAVLVLLLAVYALGIRLFRSVSPASSPDRGGFYAALALSTGIGPYLYTRFYIPDILLALWMTLAVHLFLIALDRTPDRTKDRTQHLPDMDHPNNPGAPYLDSEMGASSEGRPSSSNQLKNPPHPSALLPCLAFATVMALNVLTKGLIGLVFPIGFVFFYLAITKKLHLLLKLHLFPSTAVFLALAAPWHLLAALRTPAIAMPPGLGLPAKAGWAWFYLYNEHFARFLGKRIPHDYGLTPVWLFFLYLAIWVMPWTTFLPTALADHLRALRRRTTLPTLADLREHEAALSLLLWTILVLGFFSISSRQEYYSLPAIPALALMVGSLLARADAFSRNSPSADLSTEATIARSVERPLSPLKKNAAAAAHRSALNWHLFFLLPLTTLLAAVCGYFALTAPHPAPGADLSTLLAANPEFYNLSLGHLFDLTGAAMGLFRGPLTAVALGMLGVGLGSYLLRRRGLSYAANLTLAAAMTCVLLAAHEGLARFYPILGSKQLALAIDEAQQTHPSLASQPKDLIILDGELTSGSTLIFYTGQQVHLLNGRVNGLWYGSFWPDSPPIFETESTLHQLWSSPRRIFLFTYNPTARAEDLTPYGLVHTLASAGGKTVLTNR
jgi:4-amino-4-deoxy-L-arabinose transferase-like glycosyltransferase